MARPAGRAQNFESFAVIVGKKGETWGKDYRSTTLVVNAHAIGAPLPSFGGTLRATADERGARIELGERTVVSTPSGLALVTFWPDGTLMRSLDFPDRGPWIVPYHGAVYRLAGETPCVTVTRDVWTDITPALASGSAVATLLEKGSVIAETRFEDTVPVNLLASGIHGDADARTVSLQPGSDGKAVWTVELTRSGGRRTVFRFALDRLGQRAAARLRSGVAPSISLCSQPPTPLFRDGGNVDVIRPNFENESYFGAGWSGVELAGTGRVRLGSTRATLLIPLESGRSYRMAFDVSGPPNSRTSIELNGAAVGACAGGEASSCAVDLRPLPGTGPVSTVTMVTLNPDGSAIRPRTVILRGARIERTP
jgi:hypothetical protein